MMVQVVSSLALSALPAMAEVVACDIAGVPLEFMIDHNQFAPPVDVNEPPRQARTFVRFGTQDFAATPFVIGKARGFEADGNRLFVMQPDGEAVLSDQQAGTRITGTCTLREDEQ